jgi:dienelactone hydrolase
MSTFRVATLAVAICLGALPVERVFAQAPPPPSAPEAEEAPKLAEDIHETIARVPVTVKLLSGKQHRGQFIVTHFRPKGDGPFPVVVMNHGRAAARAKRAKPPRFRSTVIARFWIRRGFAVFVPTRLGYGDAGLDPDPENSGRCDARNYGLVLATMVDQIGATVEFAKSLPWVDPTRVVIMGQSYGGLASIGSSARALPGLVGAINFAGGGGGDPVKRPAHPCSPDQLSGVLREAGKQAKVPMLWLYSENDKYWGSQWPRRWHAAYTKGGGKADMTMFPPVDEDGHKLISKGFRMWRPVVDQFVGKLGFPVPRSSNAPPASGFAHLEESAKLPFVQETVKTDGYQKFLDADVPRAFAIAPTGNWAWRFGVPDAVDQALASCARSAKQACRLYAVDDAVVWQP